MTRATRPIGRQQTDRWRRPSGRAWTAMLAAALVASLVPAGEVAAADLSLRSGDGVGLTLAADGSVAGFGIGRRDLPRVGPGGFSLRKVGGTPNLLTNGGFEDDLDLNGVPDGWTPSYSPPVTLTNAVAHSGSRSVEVHRDAFGASGLLRIDVPVRPSTEYTISAWMRSEGVKPYYSLYPEAFTRRTDPAREGSWGQRRHLGQWADKMADFGMALDVLGLGNDSGGGDTNDAVLLPLDNAEGIYASAYNHDWGYKFRLPDAIPVPTYEQAIALLHQVAAGPTDTEQHRKAVLKARAGLASTARDYNGRLVFERYVDKFLQYYLNLDPLPAAAFDAARVGHDLQIGSAIVNAHAVGARLDAIHFDSTSGMRRWGAYDDYSHRHWAVAAEPLTFSYDSGLVVARISFSDFGQIQREADYLHGRGMILSSNFNGSEARAGAWFGADKIDFFGLEQGLPEKTGEGDIYVTRDSMAMFKRTLAYKRPLTTLDPLIGRGMLTNKEIERRLQLNLFYGIYAGIGGGDDKITERAHQLYLRYVPMFREIGMVGWEPVTLATASDPQLWLERYGSLQSGPLYIAIRNETKQTRSYLVTVDLRAMGAPDGVLTGRELVDATDVVIGTMPHGARATFSGAIAPGSTQLVRITRAP